jgi:preprotein translocase subunit SecG
VNPILAFAQLLACFGLIASILLQSRGAGLGATFGGESSAYHSRRGVEKRLFQLTVALTVLFVGVSIVTYLFF